MNREDIKEIQEKECTACSGSGCYCDGACGGCDGTGLEYSKYDIDAFKETYMNELEHDLLEMSKAVVEEAEIRGEGVTPEIYKKAEQYIKENT